MSEDSYQVIVLGGGAGGVPAAIKAAQLGARVAIIEPQQLGGLCMNRGCIPFGHMMIASNILGSISFGKEMGIKCGKISKDYAAISKRHNQLIAFMRMGIESTLKRKRVHIVRGKGRLLGKGKIEVNGKILHYEKVVLATGAHWLRPSFPGAELEEVINTDDFLNAEKLPPRALLFGTSPWLIQIAQFLHRFDSQVFLATKEKTILSNESKTISSRLKKSLKGEGIGIKTKAEIVTMSKKKDGVHVELNSTDGSETFIVDRIIHIERAASLKGLGLGAIHLDENNEYVKVNDKLETGSEGVYAIGDLTQPPSRHYSHLASEQGVIAAENAMGGDAAVNPKTFTRILFAHPQVACVGLTPKEAKRVGYDVVVGTAPYSMNPVGMMLSDNEGIVEVVTEKKYGELLGIHFIGKDASEMAGQAVLAIQMEATVEDLARTTFPHPTLSESLAEAARSALGNAMYLP